LRSEPISRGFPSAFPAVLYPCLRSTSDPLRVYEVDAGMQIETVIPSEN
jgi:hypothetical protein